MSENDIAILLAAQKALKEDVREMLAEFKEDHNQRAEKRWEVVLRRMDKQEERCFVNIPLYQDIRNHLEKSEKAEELIKKEQIQFLWKTMWVPISGILTFIGWVIFESWRKGLK